MIELDYKDFAVDFEKAIKTRKPLGGQIELTYRCNLDCVHCYCKGSENREKELTTEEWKDIIDEIHREGCLWLTFTGGEPFLRKDFLEIYKYASRKGFLITIFTNGTIVSSEILEFFKTKPPFLIEISLYATNPIVYEVITQTKGSFKKVMENIDRLVKTKIPLFLKTVILKQNKEEIVKVKALSEKLLGKRKFKCDFFIFSRINGDKTPCKYRLSPYEILEVENSDIDMIEQRKRERVHRNIDLHRPREYLYQCNAWLTNFFISPYGSLQFCHLTEKFSVDLKEVSFREGFYNEFPKLLDVKFKTDSKCKTCSLRRLCYFCPSRAFLETGSCESPVEYYCQLASQFANNMR